MKQMLYTIQVVTTGPVSPESITKAILEDGPPEATSAEVTHYRVLPAKKAAKVEAVKS